MQRIWEAADSRARNDVVEMVGGWCTSVKVVSSNLGHVYPGNLDEDQVWAFSSGSAVPDRRLVDEVRIDKRRSYFGEQWASSDQ